MKDGEEIASAMKELTLHECILLQDGVAAFYTWNKKNCLEIQNPPQQQTPQKTAHSHQASLPQNTNYTSDSIPSTQTKT